MPGKAAGGAALPELQNVSRKPHWRPLVEVSVTNTNGRLPAS
jgi:hypothetical protein